MCADSFLRFRFHILDGMFSAAVRKTTSVLISILKETQPKLSRIALFNEFFFLPDSQSVDAKPNLKRDINEKISIYCIKIQPNTIELSRGSGK